MFISLKVNPPENRLSYISTSARPSETCRKKPSFRISSDSWYAGLGFEIVLYTLYLLLPGFFEGPASGLVYSLCVLCFVLKRLFAFLFVFLCVCSLFCVFVCSLFCLFVCVFVCGFRGHERSRLSVVLFWKTQCCSLLVRRCYFSKEKSLKNMDF